MKPRESKRRMDASQWRFQPTSCRWCGLGRFCCEPPLSSENPMFPPHDFEKVYARYMQSAAYIRNEMGSQSILLRPGRSFVRDNNPSVQLGQRDHVAVGLIVSGVRVNHTGKLARDG